MSSVVLFHYGRFDPLMQHPGLVQAGPCIEANVGIPVLQPSISLLRQQLVSHGWHDQGVLIHFTDPFQLTISPLRGIRQWNGPRLIACGDLHHGPAPIVTLAAYLQQEPHDAVLLMFNPALLIEVRQRLSVPVHSCPPSFFRYPTAKRLSRPKLTLLHIGNMHRHPRRRKVVEMLMQSKRISFSHGTTKSVQQAAKLFSGYAVVLNIPLNNDLSHRFFEIMAAGAPQIVLANPALVGPHRELASRPDVFWAKDVDQIETIAEKLFADPVVLGAIPVDLPPYQPLPKLLKQVFGYQSVPVSSEVMLNMTSIQHRL